MDSMNLQQPRAMHTDIELRCQRCGKTAYLETIREAEGVPVERTVTGSFRQALDPDGTPVGPVIPFCPCAAAQAH